eukprot:scaffold76598_cov24-Tisochrysis_lutea.AAC.2
MVLCVCVCVHACAKDALSRLRTRTNLHGQNLHYPCIVRTTSLRPTQGSVHAPRARSEYSTLITSPAYLLLVLLH